MAAGFELALLALFPHHWVGHTAAGIDDSSGRGHGRANQEDTVKVLSVIIATQGREVIEGGLTISNLDDVAMGSAAGKRISHLISVRNTRTHRCFLHTGNSLVVFWTRGMATHTFSMEGCAFEYPNVDVESEEEDDSEEEEEEEEAPGDEHEQDGKPTRRRQDRRIDPISVARTCCVSALLVELKCRGRLPLTIRGWNPIVVLERLAGGSLIDHIVTLS